MPELRRALLVAGAVLALASACGSERPAEPSGASTVSGSPTGASGSSSAAAATCPDDPAYCATFDQDAEGWQAGSAGDVVAQDPGEGGYYDNFGDPEHQPHLVRHAEGYPDPEFKTEPNMGRDNNDGWRYDWNRFADTRYEAPLLARYTGLDSKAHYTLRVVYAGDSMDRKIRLDADGTEVHPFLAKPNPPAPIEFDIPAAATADGDLTLTWSQEPGRGGGGRGCQVAEVWLLKKP